MDQCLCTEQHVKKICSETNYHLSNNQRFAYISTGTLLKLSSTLLLALSLTTVTHVYMVLPNTQFLDYSVFRIWQLALSQFQQYDSITPVMFKLHWLPVHSRVILKLLLLVYKALNGKAPSIQFNSIQSNSLFHTINIRYLHKCTQVRKQSSS